MRRGLAGLAVLLAGALLFAGVTVWALEASGVAVIGTLAPDGSLRTTHVWYVEEDGALWLEAGTPDNAWYLDIQRDPALTLERDGAGAQRFAARPQPAHSATVRAALRARYGWRDRWVGMFVDSSRSIAVALAPLPTAPAAFHTALPSALHTELDAEPNAAAAR